MLGGFYLGGLYLGQAYNNGTTPAIVTPIALYNLATQGGTPTIATTGGTPAISTQGPTG